VRALTVLAAVLLLTGCAVPAAGGQTHSSARMGEWVKVGDLQVTVSGASRTRIRLDGIFATDPAVLVRVRVRNGGSAVAAGMLLVSARGGGDGEQLERVYEGDGHAGIVGSVTPGATASGDYLFAGRQGVDLARLSVEVTAVRLGSATFEGAAG